MPTTINELFKCFIRYEHGINLPMIYTYFGDAAYHFEPKPMINKMVEMGLLDFEGDDTWSIKHDIRQKIQNIPKGYESDPFSYFLEEHDKETDEEKQFQWHQRTDAKQRFDDYPKEKSQKRFFMWAAIIELVLLVLTLLLKK